MHTTESLQVVVSRRQQHPQGFNHRRADHQRPLDALVRWMDAFSSGQRPRSTHPKLALAEPCLHQLLRYGPAQQCHDQLYGALQQFVVSIKIPPVLVVDVTAEIFQLPASPGHLCPWSVTQSPPVPPRRRLGELFHRCLRESHARLVDGVGFLCIEHNGAAVDGPRAYRPDLLGECLFCTGKQPKFHIT